MANNAREYVFYDENAAKGFRELSLDGMIAVFIYSQNVYKNGVAEKLNADNKDERCVAVAGVSYMPISFFEKYLGASACDSGCEITLTGANGTYTAKPYVSHGVRYLPVIEAARALGFAAKDYYDSRLSVIGNDTHIDVMDSNEEYAAAGSYLVLGEYKPESFTSEDYKAARQKWAVKLVGNEQMNDMTNPTIRKKIEGLTEIAQKKWDTMNKGADRVILWGDQPPVESEELERQYTPIMQMAKAWGTYGSRLYHNEQLLAAVKDAVQWMYENMYGEAEIACTGWRDPHLFNWYFWYISAPECLTDIFFIMEDEFTLEEKKKYLKCFDYCSTFMRHWFARETAMSRICVCTKIGIATENPERLFAENVDFDMLLGFEKTIEGPHIDYCQWTHGMPHNNTYGKLNLDRVLHVASSLAGTPVAFSSPKQYNQFMILKYMYDAAMYNAQAMLMFCGRRMQISERRNGAAILADMLQMYGMFGEDEDKCIAKIIKRNADLPEVVEFIKNSATIQNCVLVDAIMNDDSIKLDGEYEYAHAWFTGDRAAQHRNGYAIGIAMSSERECAWESINGENKTGWHIGDGSTYLYTKYDREPFDYDNFIAHNINIAYRYPGTTEDSRERVARSISYSGPWKAPTPFAGSMQIEDKYIVAGMDFISYNFEGPDTHPDDSDSGGSLPIHLNDLKAKKAWFCFDEEIICLGAGISSTMNSPVHTTVEHRRIVNPAADNQYAAGELLPKESFDKREAGSVVCMEGHSSFVSLDEKPLYVNRYVCEEAKGQSYFEVGIDHGENPADASYAYAILPYADTERAEGYKREPKIEIVKNNTKCQAVRKPDLGITAYVFHEADEFDRITTDNACIVCRGKDFISVCDPTHKLDKVTVTFWSEIRITEKAPEMDIDIAYGKTKITVDTRGAVGKKFELKFVPLDNGLWYIGDYTEKDEREFFELSKKGAIALFMYSEKLFINGERTTLDPINKKARAIAKGGVIYAPVSLFEHHLSKSVPEELIIDAEGGKYAPVVECARALGYAAETFYEDRLVVIGDDSIIDAMYANPMLEEAGAYAVFGEYDVSSATSADYKYALELWSEWLVGSEKLNDLTDSHVLGRISFLENKCEECLKTLNKEPDRVILWGDKAPVESDDLWQQYLKIEAIALAWGTYGSKYYHDSELLDIILDSLEWMYENMYGEAEIAGTGWRDIHLFNWWHWMVGGPEAMTNAMVIIHEHLPMEKREKYLKCYKWITTTQMYVDQKSKAGASSRLNPGTKCGLLLEDPVWMKLRQRDCDSLMGPMEYGAGIHKADYVNWTHYCPHNISYGVCNLERALYTSSVLAPTVFDFNSPKRYTFFELIRKSFEPSMYRMQGFVMFSGRSTFGVEANYGAAIVSAALPMIGTFGEDEDRYLKSFIKRHATNSNAFSKVKARISIYACAAFNSIMDDPTVPADNAAYECGYAWFTGDRAAQHRNDYAIGLAMSSRREKSYECINSANKRGWHTGDGATYLYTRYDQNQHDGENFLLTNERVAYRFPGTTEDSRERVVRSISSVWEWYSPNTFAGGMSIADKYIVAGMDFVSLNNEGPDFHPDDYGYGGSLPVHINDLGAKKAWFCFDNEMICLGAGISSTMNSDVRTTVEHRRIKNAKEDNQYADGALLPKENYEGKAAEQSVCMEGHAGYITLDGKPLYINRYVCEEAKGQSYFEVGIDHGENPADATYAYAIVPYADKDFAVSDIQIISNTKSVQAAADTKLGIKSYVFYEAAECDGIKVSAPCLVAVTEKDGEYTLSVSDATHKSDSVKVEIGKEIDVISKNHKVSVTVKGGKSYLSINTFMAHGRKFEVKYR